MSGRYRSQAGATGDLLLVASVVLLVPSWIGGVEFLSAVGFDSLPAAVVGGVYAWGRGGLSAALLVRRWRHGTLVLSGTWLLDTLERAIDYSPAADYPTPAPYRLSLSSRAAGPAPA